MFNQILSQKKSIHKQQNQLFRIIIFCMVLFSPVILLLAPLPGFLIYQGTDNSFSHVLGWLFITLIALFEGYLFLSVWQQQELVFFKYLFGQGFNKKLLLSFFQSSILLHLFLWAGYIKVDWAVSNVVITASLYIYSACIFILQLKYKLSSKTEFTMTWPNTKIITHIIVKGNFTSYILLTLGGYASLIFLKNVGKTEVILSISSLWLLLNVYLMLQIWRSRKLNQNQYSLLLNAINPSYFKTLCKITNSILLALFVTVLILNLTIPALQLTQ